MKVLHVIPAVAARYGGPSTAIAAMCSALARRRDLSVELATTDADGAGGRLASTALPAGFVTHLFPRTLSERWKYSASLGRWLRTHATDYDLIHVHALWSYSSFAAARAALHAQVPYIIRPAGMLSSYTWSRRFGARQLYWAACERRTIQRASMFHATSLAEAEECRRVRPNARTAVIPNGVDDDCWEVPEDESALRRRCGPVAGKRPILLFLSRIHPKKGLTDLLLPAMSRLKGDLFLAIAGGADPHEASHLQQVRNEIDRLDLQNDVALLGPVAPGERWQLFDGAAALVLPSHSENFGIVVAEAMGRGCPVIVTDAVQAAEHVRVAGAGAIVPLNQDALAHALIQVGKDPEVRLRFGKAGRDYAARHFDWDSIAGQILEMYGACLSHPLAHI